MLLQHDLFICMSSVTLMHPAKAVGQNAMPFGRDTRVIPSNTVLDIGPTPPRKGKIWEVGSPSSQYCRLLLNYIGPRYLLSSENVLYTHTHSAHTIQWLFSGKTSVSRFSLGFEARSCGQRGQVPPPRVPDKIHCMSVLNFMFSVQ